ncbi:MAG: hypothetical protein ACLVME_02135 [Ezakiella coagulans]|uniref:hypothetical protein n=1 Tax=Ezakiella coagulans TaxID=46507 RepID=UPI00399C46B0
MINFNEDLSLKQITKIIIPILFLLSAIVIYSLVIKPSLNEIEAMEESIKEKNEAISELAEDSTESDEFEYNTATEIKEYDNYIDFFTEKLINKKFKYGNIMPKQLDNDEVIYPYEVETKLIFEDVKAFYDVLDNASHNITSLSISKMDDGWEADIKNIFLMDQYYGLRNIVIDNIGIESSDDVSDDEEKDGEDKEKDEEKNDEQKKESFSSSHNGAVEINEKKTQLVDFEFVDFKNENFLFSPINQGVTYDFIKREDNSNETVILNAYNSAEEDGELEMEFNKFNRIVWVTDSVVSFDFDSLAGSLPNLKLEVMDSHSKIQKIDPSFKDGKVFYDLINLEFPVFIKGFSLKLESDSRKHFSISNGMISIKDDILNNKPWVNQIYSVSTFDAKTIDSLMKIYNNKNKEEFMRLNKINTDFYIYNPSYFMKTDNPYEIFKKD